LVFFYERSVRFCNTDTSPTLFPVVSLSRFFFSLTMPLRPCPLRREISCSEPRGYSSLPSFSPMIFFRTFAHRYVCYLNFPYFFIPSCKVHFFFSSPPPLSRVESDFPPFLRFFPRQAFFLTLFPPFFFLLPTIERDFVSHFLQALDPLFGERTASVLLFHSFLLPKRFN